MNKKMQKIEPSFAALRLLHLIQEEGGLVKAADRLGLSQSAASHSISSLERTFGAKLFLRGRGSLRLSSAAMNILPHVRQILQSLEAIREQLSSEAGLQQGAIRIAAAPSLASTVLPPLLREFGRMYPGIGVHLLEGTDHEIVDWVRQKVCHCGFAALPVTGVETHALGRDEWVILAPKGEFEGQSRTTLKRLSSRRFLLSGGGCEDHIQNLFRQDGLPLPDHLLVRQMETLQAMVAERLGVSVVPTLTLRRRPKNTEIIRLSPRRFRSFGLLAAIGAIPSPALARWIELAKAKVPEIASAIVPP